MNSVLMPLSRVQIGSVCILLCLFLSSISVAIEPPITDVGFTPDGTSVLAVSQSGLHHYSWSDVQIQRTIQASAANLHCIAFSPSAKFVAIGGGNPAEDGTIEVFSWPEGLSISTLVEHKDSVRSLVWVNDSQLLSASIDREIKLWDLKTPNEPLANFSGHSRSVDAISLLNDQKTLVSAGVDQSLRVWNIETGELVRSLSQHTKPVNSLALNPEDSGLPMIASAAADRTIRFWQPTIGRMVRYARLKAEPLDLAWISPTHIVASCVDGHLRIVDMEEVKVIQDHPVIDGWGYSVAVHPSGESVVVGGGDGQLRKVDVNLPDE